MAYYLGSGNTTTWRRFERNIEADYNSVAVGKTWTNTDGVEIQPNSTLDYDFWVDDMCLCDAVTIAQSLLSPGAIGCILPVLTCSHIAHPPCSPLASPASYC
ncbi:MAG: hypothetical protein V2A74_02465 [bacterium]